MSDATPLRGCFVREAFTRRGLRLVEPVAAPLTFRPSRHGVVMVRGSVETVLTEPQVDEFMALWAREQAAAQTEADRCESLRDAIWDARCAAMDDHGWAPTGPEAA